MKIKNLKFFVGMAVLGVFTSIFLLSCMGCGGVKKGENALKEKSPKEITGKIENTKEDNESLSPNNTQNSNSITSQNIPSFKRIINREEVTISLSGNYHKILKFPNKEYPLEIKEVYPGIVTYDKYDSLKIIPYHHEDSIWIFNRVKDKIEFYKDGKFLSTFNIDHNNPYLKVKDKIKVLNHYSDAEGTEVLMSKEEVEEYEIDTYHLRQDVSNHGSYTSINYWKNEISQGWIVNTISTVVLLDSIGNVIFTEEYDRMMSPPAISPDGQYLMVGFAGMETASNAGVKSQADGFEIWQTQPKEILHREVNNDFNMWINGVVMNESFLVCDYSYPNSIELSTTVFLFETTGRALFNRTFSSIEWTAISNSFRKYNNYDKIKLDYIFKPKALNHGK